jgi:hypothetical protein
MTPVPRRAVNDIDLDAAGLVREYHVRDDARELLGRVLGAGLDRFLVGKERCVYG